MDNEKLENVLEKKIEPFLDSTMKKFLGIRISEIKSDISDRILKSPLIGLKIEYSLPFKEAKRKFKEMFLEKELKIHYGNISEVARITGINRRSIHRLVNKNKSEKIRKELFKPYYLKQKEIETIIENVLENYKNVINETKYETFYSASNKISKEITDQIPSTEITLKEAEKEFEKKYLKKHLKENNFEITKVSSIIKLRYETLIRKIKKLGITKFK